MPKEDNIYPVFDAPADMHTVLEDGVFPDTTGEVRYEIECLRREMLEDSASAGKSLMVWVDIETTGFDVMSNSVLEIAVAITDKYGIVVPNGIFTSVVSQHFVGANQMVANEFVLNMHTQNGLLCELQSVRRSGDWSHDHSQDNVDYRVNEFIKSHMQGRKAPMSGSSVHFDMAHLKSWKMIKNFTHRTIDVSGIRELAYLHNPEVANAPYPETGRMSHRALSDVRDSLLLYRHQLAEFLWTEKDALAASSFGWPAPKPVVTNTGVAE